MLPTLIKFVGMLFVENLLVIFDTLNKVMCSPLPILFYKQDKVYLIKKSAIDNIIEDNLKDTIRHLQITVPSIVQHNRGNNILVG